MASPRVSAKRRSKRSSRQLSRAKKSAPTLATAKRGAALRDLLRLSEDPFLRSVFETAATPILLLTPTLTVLEFNAEAERVYGRPRGELLGRAYFHALDPKREGGLTRSDFEHVLSGRPMRGIEGRVRRPDGSERVLLWNAGRLINTAGAPLGVIAVAQDITERQRAEEALREREARLRSVIATAPDAIITIDERGIIQSFSTTAEKLFGYVAGEVIGRNVKMLMPSPHQERHDEYLERYKRTGEKRIIGIGRQVEARRKDGTVFPMELAVGEVRLGNTHVFTGFIRDLSERTNMEQDLRQAQKMEAIGQLTGGLAHDFNNLLTVISGNLEMLERRLDRAEDRDILREAQEAAELGAKLSNRLLAFGRRQQLMPKPINLSTLTEGMLDLLRRTLGETVRLETRLAPDLRTTMADPGQVENALLNLALNARDAMPSGGLLAIETANVDLDPAYAAAHADVAPGSYAMLGVTDTGVGMPAEVRERAFEPFYTTKGPGLGSGLGLSMVYGFVKQTGGHVQLSSEPGRGTTVRMLLPVEPADGSPTKRRAAPSAASVKGETILVAEDDPRVRRVSVRRLQELGYRVIQVDNGPAALEVLRREPAIDLLFTDVVMPGGMSGIDLARKARESRPTLKVILTSGYAEQAIIESGMPTVQTGWLAKPYNSRDLAAKLRELLDA